jgi:glycosyltransferase involved in cell wall biosynthesis
MLTFEGVINPLSFGYITNGIAKELWKRNINFNFLPIAGNLDWSPFDKENNEYKQYITNSASTFVKKFSINNPAFKIWHINDSWKKMSKNDNYLLTFHELDQLTDEETNILNSFDKVFVTSKFSKSIFEDFGIKPKVSYIPMGVDTEIFYDLKKPRPFQDIIVFGIFGKFEKRKRSMQTIQAWAKKYGNDIRYKLHLYVTNPFCKPEEMNAIYSQVFDNKPKPFNIDIFPYLPTNSHLNSAYNDTDIILDMSGGESISLGSLNCVSMGKYAVVNWNTGIKDWATEENSIIVKPNGKEPCYDGKFFIQGTPFNAGNIYTYDTEDFINGCETAIYKFKANPVNENGKKLQETYSFKVGTDELLKEINT